MKPANGRRIVGITLGDPGGVGPEIALKTVLDPRVGDACRPALFGSMQALQAHARVAGMALPALQRVRSLAEADWKADALPVVDTFDGAGGVDSSWPRIGQIEASHGAAAMAALEAAVDTARDGQLDAVIGGPIHELAIRQAGVYFDGHPSFLARRTGTQASRVFLMLCHGRKRIVHATLHVSVRQALEMIDEELVSRAIAACDAALRRIGCSRPRIGVSGLNPHAGEGGLFGAEDGEIIAPAVRNACAQGIDVFGPLGADTLLAREDCDAFVVMLHDQGHVAAKLAAPHTVAALTIGTPVIFSSVGHGTALDIAGRGQASAEAMVQAVLQVTNTAASRALVNPGGPIGHPSLEVLEGDSEC